MGRSHLEDEEGILQSDGVIEREMEEERGKEGVMDGWKTNELA